MQGIPPRGLLVVLAGATLVAVISAYPYAGSWNDGSRLATVETLVDYGTFQIDNSSFVEPQTPGMKRPYPAENELLIVHGTRDKMRIDGHYYSDKSPVPAVLMAGVYQGWRWLGGPSAAERPDWFCWVMTLVSSGLAYVVAVGSLWLIATRIGLPVPWAILLVVVFALGTVAIAYVQHVNNHMILLGVAMALFLGLQSRLSPVWIGFLAGLAYAIDLGAGPPLVLAVGVLVTLSPEGSRWAKARTAVWYTLGTLPWLIAHHALNYAIGGTIGPANAVPAYFDWPGSPFHAGNMTGGWNHSSLGKGLLYALDMLFGKRGFLPHNLPLFLLLPVVPILMRRKFQEKPIVVAGLVWAVGTWLIYAATSRYMSGMCCSVRWFVPLLAPGFFALAVLLREYPEYRADFAVLSGGALLMGIGMAIKGPWTQRMIPFYWAIYASTIAMWGWWNWRRRQTAILFKRGITRFRFNATHSGRPG